MGGPDARDGHEGRVDGRMTQGITLDAGTLIAVDRDVDGGGQVAHRGQRVDVAVQGDVRLQVGVGVGLAPRTGPPDEPHLGFVVHRAIVPRRATRDARRSLVRKDLLSGVGVGRLMPKEDFGCGPAGMSGCA